MSELPLVYMSTESTLKQEAVRGAFEKAGLSVTVAGRKVDSGVNEQPYDMDETCAGALNRHENLRDLELDADYFITVESGLHKVHDSYGTYGCTVVVVEPVGQPKKVGFSLDVEFPQSWLDEVPSIYADMGVLVQKKFGAVEKDPITFLTNGMITRKDVVEQAIFNVVSQIALGKDRS